MINKDIYRIGKSLEKFHSVFYTIWQLGTPIITKKIKTAGVFINDDGEIEFWINEDFWNSIDDYKKSFVLCHECMHLILSHQNRFNDKENLDSKLVNYSTDTVINELLISKFGFDRSRVDKENKYCW
jgi:predicted metal-dependent peptidase